MAWQPKSPAWQDRISTNPNYRRLTNVNDSSDTGVYLVERAEGEVQQEGSVFNASAMQDLEQRIQNMNDTLFGTIYTVTLLASAWNASTHIIDVAIQGVTTVSNQEIFGLPATSQVNIENNEALQQANLMDAGQSLNTISLYAQNVPTTDLQIRVLVRT